MILSTQTLILISGSRQCDKKNIKINKNIFKKFPVVLLVTDHTRFNYGLIEKETKYLFDTRNKFKRKNNFIKL